MCGDSNDFIIPKGLDFPFTVQIKKEDTLLPQPLDEFTDGTFSIITRDTGKIAAGTIPVVLNKVTEDVIAEIPAVETEVDLTVTIATDELYTITVEGTTYSVDYTDGSQPATTAEIATALINVMGVMPADTTSSASGATITIKQTKGEDLDVTFSGTNMAQTRTVDGEELVEESGNTFYSDNGYLRGTILAANTGKLVVARGDSVDDYYLKPDYQAVVIVNFTDATLNKVAIVCKVYVTYTGV